MQSPSPTAAFGRLGRKIGTPIGETAPWSAPPIPDLINRIDAALKRRGRG